MSVSGARSVPGELGSLTAAREWASGLATEAGLPAADTWDLELALTEALSNVIRHGLNGSPGDVELRLAIDDDRVVLTVLDRVPYVELGAPAVDASGAGGYGLGMIEQIAAEVHRRPRDGGGAELEVVVRRRPAGD